MISSKQIVMANSSLVSLPRSKCMKCRDERTFLMSSDIYFSEVNGYCTRHQFCQACFRKENITLIEESTANVIFKCPCCHGRFYKDILSIDEAVLIGEAFTASNYIHNHLTTPVHIAMTQERIKSISDINKIVIDKFESALLLNPTSFNIIYTLFLIYCDGHLFLYQHNLLDNLSLEFYNIKSFDYSLKVTHHPILMTSGNRARILGECLHQLAFVFYLYNNYSPALQFSKLAYEQRIRAFEDNGQLASYKDLYLKSRTAFAAMPPLRFAVGDEVEVLHECDGTEEWKLGKVDVLHHWDYGFEIGFTASYRVQLNDSSDPPVYAMVKADIDRYVRRVGVRSIEDTRYQARLDAKVDELSRVYCSKDFLHEMYRMLVQDLEFVEMMQSVWQIELSERIISLYHLLVLCRLPLVRTDSGYHMPTIDEVIAAIRAFFDPVYLSTDAAPVVTVGGEVDSQRSRTNILSMLRGTFTDLMVFIHDSDVHGHMLRSIKAYIDMLTISSTSDSTESYLNLFDPCSDLTVPVEMSEAISKASTMKDLTRLQSEATSSPMLRHYLTAWIWLQACLENSYAGPACECAYVYFFVKYCLDRDLGVPKLALAVYDRMHIQLSREFIRCANPICELNKLDKSTGQVKFKKCSRCHAVIYCSRDCQVAHYPEHKKLCTKPSTNIEGS